MNCRTDTGLTVQFVWKLYAASVRRSNSECKLLKSISRTRPFVTHIWYFTGPRQRQVTAILMFHLAQLLVTSFITYVHQEIFFSDLMVDCSYRKKTNAFSSCEWTVVICQRNVLIYFNPL